MGIKGEDKQNEEREDAGEDYKNQQEEEIDYKNDDEEYKDIKQEETEVQQDSINEYKDMHQAADFAEMRFFCRKWRLL